MVCRKRLEKRHGACNKDKKAEAEARDREGDSWRQGDRGTKSGFTAGLFGLLQSKAPPAAQDCHSSQAIPN
jgi:hypothetical protein